ncbi:hypothetical protein HAX54_040157 [Datura stramonium]|uniref:Uncharacterized protein n=1 Tax=Datura stramonium TaxID=4076 RepID=A0ABS8VMA0_DATST|nr:hypothetical protein [Datura stramonium]
MDNEEIPSFKGAHHRLSAARPLLQFHAFLRIMRQELIQESVKLTVNTFPFFSPASSSSSKGTSTNFHSPEGLFWEITLAYVLLLLLGVADACRRWDVILSWSGCLVVLTSLKASDKKQLERPVTVFAKGSESAWLVDFAVLFLAISTSFELLCILLHVHLPSYLQSRWHSLFTSQKGSSRGIKTAAADLAAAGIQTQAVERVHNLSLTENFVTGFLTLTFDMLLSTEQWSRTAIDTHPCNAAQRRPLTSMSGILPPLQPWAPGIQSASKFESK